MAWWDPHFGSKVEVRKVALKYGTEDLVDGWLDGQRFEHVLKDQYGFKELVRCAGEHRTSYAVFNWLEDKTNLELASQNWRGFAKFVDALGPGAKTREKIFKWLSNQDNLEKAARDWNGFAEAISSLQKHDETREKLIKLLGEDECLGLASRDWHGFSKFVDGLGWDAELSEKIFKWLSNQDNLEKAARDWCGFAEVLLCLRSRNRRFNANLFAYLSVKKNVDTAAQNWREFSKRLKEKSLLRILLSSGYAAGVFAWFEKNGVELSEDEKLVVFKVLENRRKLDRGMKHSAEQLLAQLPGIRKTLAGVKDDNARRFILKQAMFYAAISLRPLDRFREFVDSLESSKRRATEMESLGIRMADWDNYKTKKSVSVAGKASKPVALDEALSATAHFRKMQGTDTTGFKKAPYDAQDGRYWLLFQAQATQDYAKAHGITELKGDNMKEYLEAVYRYYAERANWEGLPDSMTRKYGELEKGIAALLERFGQKTAQVVLGAATWKRRLPEDIFISDVCGDCTCTTSKHPDIAESASTRIADNGYSILKLYLLERKKATHVGNAYCMAYTADGRSCMAVDGIEVTRSFEYGSPEVAEALVGLAKGYAAKCRFEKIVINAYPSNISWIKEYVAKNYRLTEVELHKIGGNEHLAEIGLESAKVLAEGKMKVFGIL